MHKIDQNGLWIFFASEVYILAMILLIQAYGQATWAGGLALVWSLSTLGSYLTVKLKGKEDVE